MVNSCYCVVCAVSLQFKILWRGYTKKKEILTVSSTGAPTDYNPSVFHRELKKIYRIVPQSPTASPTYVTNGVTDGLRTSRSARMSDACRSAQVPTDRKVWRDFWTFFVRISMNYWRNSMPPTTINFRR